MKKYVLYGFLAAFVVCLFAVIVLLSKPSTPTIESDVFYIRDWNNPEYIENWTQTIQGTVVKEMPAKVENEFNCIIEVQSSSNDGTYLVYYVDTLQHPVGEVTDELKGVNIGSYNYEESIDMVRKLAVFLSMPIVEQYQKKQTQE